MTVLHHLLLGDAVTRLVALALVALSVASWVVILWKTWLLRRAEQDVIRATTAFWQASDALQALTEVAAFDRHGCVSPLVQAVGAYPAVAMTPAVRTRLLRTALHAILARLQFGQTLLASTGAIAPFIGLLGTVWGIRHALTAIAGAGQITIERIAGPVGEALVMTAAGLAVAIPAVFAYNLLGRRIARIEAELEGFAQDLRDL